MNIPNCIGSYSMLPEMDKGECSALKNAVLRSGSLSVLKDANCIKDFYGVGISL